MGLILDTSVLIADERGKFDMQAFLSGAPQGQPAIAAITASELLHGVERAIDPQRQALRRQHVEQILRTLSVLSFDLNDARVHARVWADLQMRGLMIGAHDLQIAATAIAGGHSLATLNAQEFQRIGSLNLFDAAPFRR